MDESVPVTVVDGDEETTLSVAEGRVLRDALLEAGFDVYGAVSRQANCGGRGLCGTCGVRLANPPAPEQWHDAAADGGAPDDADSDEEPGDAESGPFDATERAVQSIEDGDGSPGASDGDRAPWL